MTRYEQFMIRIAKREAMRNSPIEIAKSEHRNRKLLAELPNAPSELSKRREARDGEMITPPKEDTRPTFDAASWKPTPKAKELLERIAKREEAKRKANEDMRAAHERDERIAMANALEEKYGESLTYADRICGHISESENNRYDQIESLVGKNGDCHSRKTTYRRWKFGKGNLSKKGWLKQPA